MVDISEVCEPFRTRLIMIEGGENKLSNATSLVLNGSVVRKLRPFELLYINFKYTLLLNGASQRDGTGWK